MIKLRFSYRDAAVRRSQGEPGLHVGQVQSYLETSRKKSVDSGWAFVDVLMGQEALAWFSKIPTNIDSRASIVAVGRVAELKESAEPVVILLGREIRTDIKGSRAVW